MISIVKLIKQLQNTLTVLDNNESKPRARKSDYRYSTHANRTHARLSPSMTGLQLTTSTTRDLGHINIQGVFQTADNS